MVTFSLILICRTFCLIELVFETLKNGFYFSATGVILGEQLHVVME